MSYIEADDRNQLILLPESLEDYVGSENAVRFIEAFVESVDLVELGFRHATTERKGRPPYSPADLLKLYIYGYINRMRSSRDLEKQTHYNLEVIWLLRRLRPDFKTIADFRKNNTEALKKVCREFTAFCRSLGLYGGQLVAVDSSRFKAVNAKDRNYNEKKLQGQIARIDRKIEEYFRQLDENDQKEADTPSLTAEELREKIEELKKYRQEKEKLSDQLKKSGDTQISTTDPDARALHLGQAVQVGYNVQFAVDQKNKLIATHEVTNSRTDLKELSNISKKAKEALQVESLEVVADSGYYSSEQLKMCEDSGIAPYVAKPDRRNQRPGYFDQTRFQYDSAADNYLCPAGEKLRFLYVRKPKLRVRYYGNPTACQNCSIKSRCTPRKAGRLILRWTEQAVLDRMISRIRAYPQKLKERKAIIEHTFGTLKSSMNQGYFLMKGLKKVSAEMSLSVLAFNFKRAINIKGTARLIQALP